MLSMTGYGRGEYKEGGIEMTVEIKTVNNRYLDMSIKAPRIFAAVEELIRNTVRSRLTRGHADVFISFSDKREQKKELALDVASAQAYYEASKKVLALFPDVRDDLTVFNILRQPEVLKSSEVVAADEQLISALMTALSAALDKLNAMRSVEGKKLEEDMLLRMQTIENLVLNIEQRAPLVAKEYADRLKEKVEKYLENVNYDESRLLTEIAVFTDKSNIDEELTRLHSHIVQFRTICNDTLVGRKLDFLVQEFNRETNTICSKSNDLSITKWGLELKNEIEKVREQVQNLE